MEFEKLSKLSDERKREILTHLIKNDVSYWKKLMILMAMVEDDDTELLDMVIEHKIEEINLANSKFNLGISSTQVEDANGVRNYTKAIETILNDSVDSTYSKACKQVLEVLKYVPNNYYELINKSFLEKLEKLSDDNYRLKIESNITFDELDLLEEAKDILELISDKFWTKNGTKVNILEIFNNSEE